MTYEDDSRKTLAKTRRNNVLRYLLNRAPLWVSGVALCEPDVGGSEGLRRLRELRAEGWKIEARRISDSDAWEYRLLPAPSIEPKQPKLF